MTDRPNAFEAQADRQISGPCKARSRAAEQRAALAGEPLAAFGEIRDVLA
jgi:hypothetical protein